MASLLFYLLIITLKMNRSYIYIFLFFSLALNACKKSSRTDDTIAKQVNYAVNFSVKDQSVKLRLNNNILGLDFYEDVTLLAVKDSLQNSYAVIFKEDFKPSELGKFSFYISGQSGNVITNYAESNLNNVTLSSVKDTTINSTVYSKISFNRIFYFGVGYNTNAEALAEYNYLLSKKDAVGFSSYVTGPNGSTTANTTNAALVYSAY
jgi:hypothetical protein